MIKCEWIDGTFIGCKDMDIGIHHSDHINFFTGTGNITIREDGYVSAAFIICPFCGADIRKPEPKQPTHEEIMTKWWDDKEVWMKVDEYWVDVKNPYKMRSGLCVSKGWFVGKESADVPPEAL